MAQLVKLHDYISRYESNPFHYPSQFIRLKQENWRRLEETWLDGHDETESAQIENEKVEIKQRFSNWKRFFTRAKEFPVEKPSVKRTLPISKEQLVQQFLNQLLPFQLKWATSTISHVSRTDDKHLFDETLKWFLQRFPDIYLLLYYPIFSVKNAPIDGDVILISPIGIEIIHVVKEVSNKTVIVNDSRIWTVETHSNEASIISPLISLKRTEKIVNSVLQVHKIDLPVQKIVLSHTNDFLYHTEPYKTQIIGKRQFDNWFMEKRRLQSSLKSVQLKAMEALLNYCQSTSIRRPEWERNKDTYHTLSHFEES